jgi:tripartite-type tricarboxylate transporter receptor subunit TctC
MLMGPMSTMSLSPAFYPNLPFHPLRDFEPVGIVASAPTVVVSRAQLPIGTLPEFAVYLRAHAGKMSNGNAGIGSASHLACLLLNSRIGVVPSIVPYRGTGPAVQDMAAGQIDYLCDQITSVMGQIAAGTIKPLALLATTRSPVLPNIPTAAEAGFEGLDMVVWNALFMPKGTPRDVVMRVNGAVNRSIGEAGIRDRFQQLGAEPPPVDQQSPEALGETLARDIEKWGAVIRAANITLH